MPAMSESGEVRWVCAECGGEPGRCGGDTFVTAGSPPPDPRALAAGRAELAIMAAEAERSALALTGLDRPMPTPFTGVW